MAGPGGERGQALVIFALAIIVLLGMAAMVFDVGQTLLDRRAQQNASDAAALAGARHLGAGTCLTSPSLATCASAVAAALDLAAENGYVHGVDGATVVVKVPPDGETSFGGLPGHIQVVIQTTEPSFFQGLLGMANRHPRALAVAANNPGITLPYQFIALNPHACALNKVTGNGTVTFEGAVQVDSDCPSSALLVSGNGAMTVSTCNVVGGFQISGGGSADCQKPAGVTPLGDPLRELPMPPLPPYPTPVDVIAGDGGIPAGCPGSSNPATLENPSSCQINKAGAIYRIFPGLYPGGLKFQKGTVYMEPGIYYLAGGGFVKSSQDPTVLSVDPGGTTLGGGVLLVNACLPGQTGACAGQVHVNGGPGGTIELMPIQDTLYKDIVIYQDRAIMTNGASVVLNGNENYVNLTGTVYVPSGEVQVNGSGSGLTTQVIADTFKVNGGGTLTMNYDGGQFVKFKGIGLVQ